MTKFFTVFSILLLLAAPAAMAEEAQNVNTASEEAMDFGADSHGEEGGICY